MLPAFFVLSPFVANLLQKSYIAASAMDPGFRRGDDFYKSLFQLKILERILIKGNNILTCFLP